MKTRSRLPAILDQAAAAMGGHFPMKKTQKAAIFHPAPLVYIVSLTRLLLRWT
jgi:hypothetical protein